MKYSDLLKENKDIQDIVKKLIIHHSQLPFSQIFLNLDKDIDFDLTKFNNDVAQYKKGIPLQYILQYIYFLDLKIKVRKGVFIPRPETEAWCSQLIPAIKQFFKSSKIVIADICSGSGAIALGLNHYTKAKTYGLELEDDALIIARQNNKLNNCNVKFVKSDIDQYLIEKKIKVDVLVANPPYVKPNFNLESSVINYEPHRALFDKDKDGLSFYKSILQNHHQTTKSKAIIAFEFGFDQKAAIEALVKKHITNCTYDLIYDYQNHPRAIIIFKDNK